jgi:hypothetical protein
MNNTEGRTSRLSDTSFQPGPGEEYSTTTELAATGAVGIVGLAGASLVLVLGGAALLQRLRNRGRRY